MNSDERWLADLLKRTVPQPPRQLTYEEITVRQHAERSLKTWVMPVLAAAAVLVIGVTLGAAATRHPAAGTSLRPVTGQAPHSSAAAPTALPSCAGTEPGVAPSVTGRAVRIPDVTGWPTASAVQALARLGLEAQIITVRASAVPHGTIARQNPPPATVVPRGTQVTLYVSAGGGSGCDSRVSVPNSIGMSMRQAEQIIGAAGLRVMVQQGRAPGEASVPPGTVWEQNPAAGTTADRGTTIIVVVQPKA